MMGKVVAFGEIMLRLTPPNKNLIKEAKTFDAYYGGTESNVLVGLAALGHETDYITGLPDNDLGEAVLKHLRSYGVGTGHIVMRGDNLGMYYLEEGFGLRGAKVIYNRSHAEVNHLTEKDMDYDAIFKDCSIFHISGISFAISNNARALSFALIREAKKRGIAVSFDFNYRGKLWSIEEAKGIYQEILKSVDIVFCAKRDIETFLELPYEEFYNNYQPQYLITRERDVLNGNVHEAWASITVYKDGHKETFETKKRTFEVLERIGGGDAFAAGVLSELNRKDADCKKALQTGMACFVLKHTMKGDVLNPDKKIIAEIQMDTKKDVSR